MKLATVRFQMSTQSIQLGKILWWTNGRMKVTLVTVWPMKLWLGKSISTNQSSKQLHFTMSADVRDRERHTQTKPSKDICMTRVHYFVRHLLSRCDAERVSCGHPERLKTRLQHLSSLCVLKEFLLSMRITHDILPTASSSLLIMQHMSWRQFADRLKYWCLKSVFSLQCHI